MLSSYFCLFVLTRSWVEETPTTHNGVGGKITKKKQTNNKNKLYCAGRRGEQTTLFNYFIPKSQENGQNKNLNNAIDLRYL